MIVSLADGGHVEFEEFFFFGAFFGGIASASAHGWVWFLAALVGTFVGTRLRPWFGLDR